MVRTGRGGRPSGSKSFKASVGPRPSSKLFSNFHSSCDREGPRTMLVYFTGLINDVFKHLPDDQCEKFDIDDFVIGMRFFNGFWKGMHEKNPREELNLHDVYESWCKKKKDNDKQGRPGEIVTEFNNFFEFLMIRSSSEAFCETVGSVMNQKTGRCHVLENNNLSEETVLQVNLGPLHLLEPMVREVYRQWGKSFLYKRNRMGGFVSRGMVEYSLGVAMRSRREREEQQSRLPTDFWS